MGTLLAMALLLSAAPEPAIVVVAPAEFRPALREWTRHREGQGLRVLAALPGGEAEKARKSEGVRYLLLLGDIEQVPTGFHQANSIRDFDDEPVAASDNAMADLDGDSVPDLAVGRIPARTREEAEALLRRVVEYETSADGGAWRRRLNVVAGVAGFGALQDWALELVTKHFLTQSVPEGFVVSMTYANPRSPYCPPPARIRDVVLERFGEGALVVAYLGHGHVHGLDKLRFEDRTYPILKQADLPLWQSRESAPIAVLVACSTGRFDGKDDGFAEAALRQPKGPVAVVAASRVSMPYANGVFAKELLEALFRERTPRLGDALLRAKRRLLDPLPDDVGRKSVEFLAANLYNPDDAARRSERLDHLFLYNLLGDPSLAIPQPEEGKLTPPGEAHPGREAPFGVESPFDGEATVEIARPRGSFAPPRPPESTKDEAFLETYRRANESEVAHATGKVGRGGISFVLVPLPKDLPPGRYVARAFVRGGKRCAVAAAEFRISP